MLTITFLFALLVGRIAYLQVVQGDALQLRAADQWTRDLPVVARRGDILDVSGKVLATSHTSYSIFVRPRAVTDADAVTRVLSATLGLSAERITDALGARTSEVKLARQADKSVLDVIKSNNLAGVYYAEDITRAYPQGDFLTQVLGFVNVDGAGQSGLELYYDRYLTGLNGQVITETDAAGVELPTNETRYLPAVPGYNMTLTVDREIQRYAEEAAHDAAAKYKAQSASVIVMEVKTGAIAAMATAPSYDLNTPPRDDLAALNALTKNKMIVDVYEPGSTFKVFTTSAALEENKVNLTETFNDPGFRIVDGQRIKCWRTHGHGTQTLAQGVNNSCNSVFMDLALRVGTQTLYGYLHDFGFGSRTGVDFFGESGGIVMNERSVKNVDLARIGFGQAVAVTPLQLITGFAAVVNGGVLYKPYFVKEIASSDGQTGLIVNPSPVRRVISAQTSATMRGILGGVVDTGSGRLAQVPGYEIGGKTGTAQKYGASGAIEHGKYVSSFIGFAPVNDPQYAVLVLVNETQGYVYYGSMVCGPYVQYMFERIFLHKKIQPTRSITADVAATTPSISVPDVLGMTEDAAVALLESLGLVVEVAGEEGTVINQIPAPGTMVYPGYVTLVRVPF
ncbi:MAG: PASTA domain-containing protein [Clostridiales bacterium]|jgi:stage V sporulation protein D (sporulation-specific penicillin-binding protein)|nr:PASTA domain-containing protein [Clostridiales bacterium]